MVNLDDVVQNWFLANGWTDHHSAIVPDTIPSSHPAHDILRMFGGITLLESDCDDDDPIEMFAFHPFSSTDSVIVKWSKLIRSDLVAIADEHNGHAVLYVDAIGRCFSDSNVHDCFAYVGDSLNDALIGVLDNRKCRPLLHPLQENVKCYGESISRGDPRLYDYTIGGCDSR